MKLLRTFALALATIAVLSLLVVFFRRVSYPYDLEWMEGGILCHALRLINHQPIYAPPSVDFIPFLYTPLYPALLFVLSKFIGLSYLVGRLVSVGAFLGASFLGYKFARREGAPRSVAFCAMAIPFAAFVPNGAWYDLARPDSLFLGLVTAGLLVGWWKRESHLGVAAAALLLVAAFFTKQTASPFMIALGLALCVYNWRVVPSYVATLAITGLPTLWLLNHASGGWFWTYVFKLHQAHDFYPVRAFIGTPVRLLLLLGPAVLIIPWALIRRRTPGIVYASFIGLVGAAAACLGFGTQWAFTNAFVPGIFFLSLAIGTCAGRLLSTSDDTNLLKKVPASRAAAVYTLLAVALLLAPGALLPTIFRVAPKDWGFENNPPTGYSLKPYLPTAQDQRAGDALIARLKAANGEVLIPFHPFYAQLAGKPAHLHRMGVLDVGRAGMGAPIGLVDALRGKRFSLVVMDNKIDGNWNMWPGLQENYQVSTEIVGPHAFSGAETFPRYVMTARPSLMIDKELQ